MRAASRSANQGLWQALHVAFFFFFFFFLLIYVHFMSAIRFASMDGSGGSLSPHGLLGPSNALRLAVAVADGTSKLKMALDHQACRGFGWAVIVCGSLLLGCMRRCKAGL